MEHVMAYLRKHYRTQHLSTSHCLREYFQLLDLNNDGQLNWWEFRHIVSTIAKKCGDSIPRILDEEMVSLASFLDPDKTNFVSWEMFSSIHEVMKVERPNKSIDVGAYTAIRKVQYSTLPDPFSHLNMFVGLPYNYRLSVLADVATHQEKTHHIAELIASEFVKESADGQVNVTRVTQMSGSVDSRYNGVNGGNMSKTPGAGAGAVMGVSGTSQAQSILAEVSIVKGVGESCCVVLLCTNPLLTLY